MFFFALSACATTVILLRRHFLQGEAFQDAAVRLRENARRLKRLSGQLFRLKNGQALPPP